MGFWDFLTEDFVKSVAPTVINAGVKLYGASQTADAYNKATKDTIAATQKATAANLEAQREANAILKSQQGMASPGLLQLQRTISQQDTLTPAQIQALDDARRTTIDSLSTGGLRGSAAATAATVRKVEGDMRGRFMDTNQNRANSAAGSLAGQYFTAGDKAAQVAVNTGNTISSGLTSVGDLNANNTIRQNAITGTAIGDIGATITDYLKNNINNERDDIYKTVDKKEVV